MEEENLENQEETTTETIPMSDKSILDDIKKLVGINKEDLSFDNDILIHINSAFMILNQLGVGPITGFSISDSSKKWKDYLPDTEDFEAVKTYIYLKVKIIFDPPLSTTIMEALKQTISELEWRLNVNAESKGG